MNDLDARVDAATLERLLAEEADIRVLDVRTPAEFESGHIPGAYNVPLDTLGEHTADLARHLSEPVVLVCRSGLRADRACEQLAASGMPNLHVLAGGVQAWDDGARAVRRGRRSCRSACRSSIERYPPQAAAASTLRASNLRAACGPLPPMAIRPEPAENRCVEPVFPALP